MFVDLREFLPQYCGEHAAVPALQDAEGARVSKVTGRRLDFAQFLVSWRLYTPAAVATDQLELEDAAQHLETVTEVAVNGKNDGYTTFLGVCYDEVARSVCGRRRGACRCISLRRLEWDNLSGQSQNFRVSSKVPLLMCVAVP